MKLGTIDFKRAHPVHYWIRVLCFSFSAVFLALWFVGSDGAEGAGTPIWEPDDPITYNAAQTRAAGSARGPNNVIYRAYIATTGMSLNVSFTDDNGSSWSDSEVIDTAWKGHTTLVLGGIVVMTNNTTLVHFVANGADDAYNSYIACRWNWSGDWDVIKVYGSAATGMSYPKMAINETKVLLTYYTASTIRYKIFDPSDSSVDPPAINLPSAWLPAADSNIANYGITVNQSGLFIIAGQTWSGSVYRYYVRDLYGEHAPIYANLWSGVLSTYSVTIMSTSDDCFSLTCVVHYPGLGYIGLMVFHGVAPWSLSLYETPNYASGYLLDYNSLVGSIDVDDYVTMYWADDTGPGGDVHIAKMTAHFQADESTWESAYQIEIYDYGTDDDLWVRHDYYNGKYPVVDGHSVNVPLDGWMGGHVYKDELGSPDDYTFALYWNATFYWYNWTAPEEPEPDPDPGDDNATADSFGVWWDTSCITSTIIIFLVVVVMAMILRRT